MIEAIKTMKFVIGKGEIQGSTAKDSVEAAT